MAFSAGPSQSPLDLAALSNNCLAAFFDSAEPANVNACRRGKNVELVSNGRWAIVLRLSQVVYFCMTELVSQDLPQVGKGQNRWHSISSETAVAPNLIHLDFLERHSWGSGGHAIP